MWFEYGKASIQYSSDPPKKNLGFCSPIDRINALPVGLSIFCSAQHKTKAIHLTQTDAVETSLFQKLT